MGNKENEKQSHENQVEDKKIDKKKKLTIKEIGLEKLVIIFLCGIFLIVLSVPDFFTSNKKTTTQKTNDVTGKTISQNNVTTQSTDDTEEYTNVLETKLKNILKKVGGIGEVEVMITVKSSKELVTLKDKPYTQESLNETDGEGGSRINNSISNEESSVLVTTGEGDSLPYVIKEIEPEIEGVLVIAEGGDDPNIITEIINAVEVLFDVPTHKIKVMKMN